MGRGAGGRGGGREVQRHHRRLLAAQQPSRRGSNPGHLRRARSAKGRAVWSPNRRSEPRRTPPDAPPSNGHAARPLAASSALEQRQKGQAKRREEAGRPRSCRLSHRWEAGVAPGVKNGWQQTNARPRRYVAVTDARGRRRLSRTSALMNSGKVSAARRCVTDATQAMDHAVPRFGINVCRQWRSGGDRGRAAGVPHKLKPNAAGRRLLGSRQRRSASPLHPAAPVAAGDGKPTGCSQSGGGGWGGLRSAAARGLPFNDRGDVSGLSQTRPRFCPLRCLLRRPLRAPSAVCLPSPDAVLSVQ